MKLFRHTYKRRAALVTLLVHVLLVGIFYSFGLTYMDPKIERHSYWVWLCEEALARKLRRPKKFKRNYWRGVRDEAAAPTEEPTVSEEIIQDIEEAPALVEEIEQEQMEEPVSVKEEEKPQASTELQQALSSLFQSTETTLQEVLKKGFKRWVWKCSGRKRGYRRQEILPMAMNWEIVKPF